MTDSAEKFSPEELAKLPKWAARKIDRIQQVMDNMSAMLDVAEAEGHPERPRTGCYYSFMQTGCGWRHFDIPANTRFTFALDPEKPWKTIEVRLHEGEVHVMCDAASGGLVTGAAGGSNSLRIKRLPSFQELKNEAAKQAEKALQQLLYARYDKRCAKEWHCAPMSFEEWLTATENGGYLNPLA